MTPRETAARKRARTSTRQSAGTNARASTRTTSTRQTPTRKTSTRTATRPRPEQAAARRARGAAAASPAEVERQLLAIERNGGEGELELGGGTTLHVSSLGKEYFPGTGITKGALMRYYTRVSPALLPELEGRPLVLKRYPDGAGGPMFFQQDAGAHVPDVVRVQSLPTEEKGMRARIIGGDLATLLYTVQLGAIEVHPWLSRVADIDSPDRCLIDLDPGEDVPFSQVVALAKDVLTIVRQVGLTAGVKTSGSRGIHVVLPLPPKTSYEECARLASLVARAVVAMRPERATVERSIDARPPGTIYVDAMQNARGKSMASAYSARAKPGAPVSAPLAERELAPRLTPRAFTVRTMPARFARTGDRWGRALEARPTARALARALQVLEATLAATPPQRAATRRRGGEGAGAAAGGRRPRRR